MRRAAIREDTVRSPLNNLLNAEANVRLLRVLAEADDPLSARDAADLAQLTEPGARLALKRLEATGFVRRSGASRSHRFALRHEDPLTEAIVALFATERRRYDALLVALRLALVNSSSPPRSAWISRLPHEPGASLEIVALHRTQDLPGFMREIREKLSFIETSFDLTVEVNGHTRADLPETGGDHVISLIGPPPPGAEAQAASGVAEGTRLDRESGLFADGVAALLERDPTLVERALRRVDEALGGEPGEATEDLREWQRVLGSYPIPRLKRFLTSNSLRSLRLRRTSPFPAVLTAAERERLEAMIEAAE